MGGLRDFDITAAIWDAAYKDCREETAAQLRKAVKHGADIRFLHAKCSACGRCALAPRRI